MVLILNNLAKKLESLSRDIEKKDNSDEGAQFFQNMESRGNAINAMSSEIEGVNKTLSGYNKEFEALEEEQLNLGVQYKTGALPYTDYLRLFNEAAAKKDNVISEFNEVAARGKELETQYLSSIDLYNKEKAKAPSNPLITEYNKTRERLTEVMRAYRVYEDDEDFQELLKAYGKSEDFKDVFKVFAPEEHRQKILLEAQEAYANAVTLERNSKTRGGKAWMDFKNTLQILGGMVEITKDINPFGQINTPTGGGFVPNIASLFGGWVLNTANDFFSLAELGLNKVGVDEKTLKKVENFRRDELSFPQSMVNAAMGGAKRHFYEEQLELKSSNIGDESLYEVFKPRDKLVIDNGEVVGIRSKDSDILEGFLSEDTKNAAQNIYNANKDKTTSSFSLVGGIEDAVPSILDLVAMMYGGSAITKMARGFRLPVVPVLEKYGIKTGTVLGDGVITPTTSVGFSFLQQYGDIYDSHIQRGVGVSEALNYAFKETAVSSFMEIMFSPFEMKLQKSVNSRMFGQLIDAKNATIRDVISGRTPLIGWGDTFLKYTKQKGGALVENYVKDVIPEVVTEILQNYNSAHWEAESKDEMTKLPSFSENVNAAFGAAFITAAVGLPSANSKYNIDLRATVTYNAVNNPNGIISDTDFKTVQEAKEWLNKYGLVTTDEKLKKKAQQIVLAYDEILPQVKKELEAFEGENLTEEQKVAIAGAALDKAIAKAKLLKETDKSSRLSNKLGSIIANADARIDYIVKNPDSLSADPILKSRNWSLVHEDRDKHKGVIIWDKGVSPDREYKVGDKVDFGSLGSITITEIGKDASGNPMFRYETNDKKKAKRQETQNQDNTEEEEVTTESTTSAQREAAATTEGEQVTEEVVPQGGEVNETVEGVDFSVGNYDIKGDKVAKRQVSADGATTTTVDVEVKEGQTVQEAIEEHIEANRRQELDSVSTIINQEDKAYLEERINQRADKDLQDVKDAFKDRGTARQANEVVETKVSASNNVDAKADTERRRQALKDLMEATGDDIFILGTQDGTFAGDGLLNMNDNGDVVLTRYADSEEGLTKGKGKTENLASIAGQFGGEQIATSGIEGGLQSFTNGVVGEYHIPLNELIQLIKDGYVVFAGLGNKEFVLSPHIADKYLTKVNGQEINTKYNAELAELEKQQSPTPNSKGEGTGTPNVEDWSREQQTIENDKTLSTEQKEKAKIESTAKALEGVDETQLISGEDVWNNATKAGSENNDFIENMEEYEGQIKGRQYLKVPISIDLLRANDKDLNEYLNDIDTSVKKRKIETPIIVGDAERGAFETTKDGVIDGFHRAEQAIINGEKNIIAFVPINSKIISETYHKAKADGSNPELVAAVEELLKPKEPTKVQEVKQDVEVQEQQETAKVEETPKKTAPKAETNKITFKLTNTGEKEFTKVGDLWQYEVGGKTKTVRSESNIAALDKELARVNSLEVNTPTTPQQGEVVNEGSETKNTTKAPLSVEDVISKINKLLVDPNKKNNRANVSLFGLDIVFNGIKDNIGIPLWNRAIRLLSKEVEKGSGTGRAILKAANYIEENIKGKDWGRKAFINNFKFYFSRLEGINSKGVTVSITPYAGARIQKYKNLQDSLNAFITAGNFKAAQEVAKEMQDDLIFRLNQLLPDVKIKGKSVDGLWQGSAEQSFSLHIDKVSDDVFAAIVKIAQDFDQDAVHILYLSDKINNDEIVGVEDANGRAIIPVVHFKFDKPITAAEFGKIVKDNGLEGASLDSDGRGATIYDSTMYATKEEAEKGHKVFFNKVNNIENDSKRITGTVRRDVSYQRFAAFKRGGEERNGRTYAWGHGNIQKSDEYRARENDERTASGWAVRHLPKKVRDAVQKVASLTPKIGTYLNLNKSSDDYKRLQSIGRMFDRMPLVDLSPKVKAAYNALNEIIKAQYDRLPIKVYPNNRPIISHENIEQIQGIVNELNTAIEAKDIKKITELQKQLDNVVGWSENRYDDAYSNSKQMMADVNRNNQMEFFTTGSGFGDGSVDYTGHPLLEPTYYYTTPVPAQDKNGKIIYDKDGNEVLIPKQLSNNDVLRVVHDYVAHAASGASFGAKGEERAWAAHVASIINEQGFSDRQKLIAIQALTSETRGQNTWVNFVNEFNRDIRNPLLEIKRNAEKNNDLDTAAKADEMLSELPYTEFADQKVGLLPTETMIGGYEETADADKWIKEKIEANKLYESEQSDGNMKEQSLPEDISEVGKFIEDVREKDNKSIPDSKNQDLKTSPQQVVTKAKSIINFLSKKFPNLFAEGQKAFDEKVAKIMSPRFQALQDKLAKQYDFLFKGKAVAELSGKEFEAKEGTTLKQQINDFFNTVGNKAQSVFGDVVLDNRAYKDDSSHGQGREKISAYQALPEILKNGVEVLPMVQHKADTKLKSGMIAAPITIDGKEYVAVAVVRQNKEGDNRLYVHEVTLKEKLLDSSSNPVLSETTQATNQGAVAKVLQNIVDAKNNPLKFMAENFRGNHSAPNMMGYDNVDEAIEDSADTNLSEIARGKHLVPDDYFIIGSRYPGHDTKNGRESKNAILKAIDKLKKGTDPKSVTVKMYRAVPKDITLNHFIANDWITPSKGYAISHGESRFGKGGYKIIEEDVPAHHIWWDGNDINEWGFDSTNDIRFLKDKDGTIFGLYDPKENKIYLNEKNINPKAVWHEATHFQQAMLRAMAGKGNIEAQRILNQFDKLLKPFIAQLEKGKNTVTINGQDIPLKADVYRKGEAESKEAYRERMQDEVWAFLQQEENNKLWQKNDTAFKRLVNKFKEAVINLYKSVFNIPKHKDISNMTLVELVEHSAKQLQDGRLDNGNFKNNKHGLSELQYSMLDKSDFDSNKEVKPEVLEEIRKEREKIVREAKANGTYMKAPNGKATNLNEQQWVDVRTKRFGDWFGDWEGSPENASKVVDENGEPLVVYHTSDVEFYKFDENKIGKNYTLRHGNGFYFSSGILGHRQWGSINKMLFLNIRNIRKSSLSFREEAKENGFLNTYDNSVDIASYAKKVGVDGLFAGDSFNKEFIVFSPNQIKSATSNVGTFSNESNDIRFSISNSNTNFVEDENTKRYKDSQGNEIPYNVYTPNGNSPSSNLLQREGSAKQNNDFALVERRFIRYKQLNFTAGTKIKSLDDVAWLFRNLEDEAVEHSFVTYIMPDDSYVVQHLGTGGITGAIIDNRLVVGNAIKMGAKSITFVHNHPSGKLEASKQDMNVYSALKKGLEGTGIDVQDGVIINLKSGKFVTFDSNSDIVRNITEQNQEQHKVKVLSFSKQVFAENYNPEQIKNSSDVAKLLSTKKFGVSDKTEMLILNNSHEVVGKFVLPESNQYSKIVELLTQYGGVSTILYGNNINPTTINEYNKKLRGIGFEILDGVEVKSNNFKSLADIGLINEGESDYNKNNTENENNLSEILDNRGIDNVSLRKLNEYGKQIEQRMAIYQRFSQEEQRGFTSGGSRHVEASLIAGRSVSTGETQDDRADRQEEEVETYAKQVGIWHDNTEEYLSEKYGEPINSGNESLVYYNTENATVVKTSNISQYRDLEDALDSITLHNTYFPESNIQVLGFGLDGDENFQIITEQPYITEGNRKATQEEIDDFVQKLGFEPSTKLGIAGRYVSDQALLNDLTPKNVILTPKGQIVPIDTIMHLNTEVWGESGKRIPNNNIYRTPNDAGGSSTINNIDTIDSATRPPTLKEAATNLKDAVLDLFIGGNNKLGIHYDPKMEALNFYNKGGKVFKTFVDLMKSVATQAGVATMDSKGKLVWKEWANVTQQEKDGLFTEFRNALTRLNTNINIDEDGLEYLALWASDSELMKAKVKAISALQDEIDSLYESFARGETNRQDFAIKVQEVLKDFNRDQKNTSYFSASDIAKLLKAAKDVKDTASLNNFENKFYDIVSGKDFNKLKAATVKLKKAAIRAIQTIKNPNTTSNNPNGVTQGKERLALSYNPLDRRAYNKLPQVLNLQRLPNESNTAYKRAQRLEAERLYREDIRRFNDMLTVMANKEIGKDSAKYKNDINYFADMAAHQFNIKEQEKALRESTYDTDGNLLDIYGNIETLYQDLPAEYQEVADVRKLQFDNNGNIIDTDGNIIKDFNSLDEKELRELERRKKLEDKELNKIQTAAEKEQARLDNKDKIRNLINIGRQVLPFKEFQAILDDFLSITDEQLDKLSNQELEELIKGYDNLINLNRVNTGFEYLIKKALDGSVATEVINTLDSRGNSFRSLLRDRITNIFKGKNIVEGIERFMRNTPLRRIDAIFSGKEGTEMYDTFIYKIAQGMGVFTAFSNKLKDEYRGLTKSIKQDDEFLLRLYTMDRQYRNNPDSDEIMSVAEEVELIREAISLDKNLKESLYADFVELYDKLQMEHGGEFDYTKIQLDKRQQALLDFVDTHLDNTVGKVVVTAARTGEATKIYNNYTPLGRVSSKSITDEMKDFADGIMDFDGGVANREYFSPITPGFIKARQSGKISPIRDVLFSRVTYEAIRGIHLDYNMRDAFKTFENRIKDTERELDNKIKDIRKDAKDKVEKLTEQLENQKQVLTFQLQGADARTARVLNGQIADIDKQIKALDESDIIKASEEKIDAYKNDKMFIQVMGKVVKDVAKDTLHNQYAPLSGIDIYTELVASVGYASVLTSIPRGMAEFASNIFYACLNPS